MRVLILLSACLVGTLGDVYLHDKPGSNGNIRRTRDESAFSTVLEAVFHDVPSYVANSHTHVQYQLLNAKGQRRVESPAKAQDPSVVRADVKAKVRDPV